jgi:hypothetical protein
MQEMTFALPKSLNAGSDFGVPAFFNGGNDFSFLKSCSAGCDFGKIRQACFGNYSTFLKVIYCIR